MAKNKIKIPEDLSPEVLKLCQVLNEEDDYPCILLSTSFLEQVLGTLLASCMVRCEQTVTLLDPSGPLESLGARANAAYCLGLIPYRMWQNIDMIRTIRNDLAHSYFNIGFKDQTVKDRCMNLHLPIPTTVVSIGSNNKDTHDSSYENNPRNRFTYVVLMMANRILLTALGKSSKEIPPAQGKEWYGQAT